jgi:hypothetical protein
MTDAAKIQKAEVQAEVDGYEAGRAAGTWVIDGNTSTLTAKWLLEGIEAGDPEVYDQLPGSPLSGEWADAPLPRDILEGFGMSEDDDAADDVLGAFESGFSRGVEDEVVRAARIQLA